MKYRALPVTILVLFTSGCSVGLLLDGTADFTTKRKAMWAIQSDVADGVVTPVAVANLPASGSADFAGHFLIADGATNGREILFGNVAMTYNFGTVSNQLTGKVDNIMLVDNEGQKIYGFPAPKITDKFSGSLAFSGTVDADSIPFTASGTIVDKSGTGNTMTLKADPSFYQAATGDYVLSSPWATGTLTTGGVTKIFDSGYLGATQSP